MSSPSTPTGAPIRSIAAWANEARPYRAAFAARYATLLAYRSAALAGVVTQCWWGAIKVMILSAFYAADAGGSSRRAPISLPDAITYTWISQALFAMLPWTADPDVVQDVKSGAVAYDRLRPVDTYVLAYARSAGWLAGRTLPRALLLAAITLVGLPLVGLRAWAWQLPSNAWAALGFAASIALALALSAAVLMVINAIVIALYDERGVNALSVPIILLLSGSLLPLALYPEGLRPLLLVQPLAGLLEIPLRIYFGDLAGKHAVSGLLLQLFWTTALVLLGRLILRRAFDRLRLQGG
jgi:ABC-2 type transport system permease protein